MDHVFSFRSKILDDLVFDREHAGVPTSLIRLQVVAEKESLAVAEGAADLTREQAEAWCALHVGDNWYDLPLMLMARGYGMDYREFTEVGADSVYEPDESGCYIELPEWWDRFELWRRG